ncbi:hypothetical protein QJQ45_007423 [Haematococcus lacustris]|nr:hypothetical protein QJQ45_007423 [Haematococcus lacustris]
MDQQQLQGAQHQLAVDQQQLQDAQHQLAVDQQQLQGAQHHLAVDQQQLQDAQHQLGLDQQQLQDAQHQLAVDQQQLQDAQHQLAVDQQQLQGAQHQLGLDQQQLQGAQHQLGLDQQQLQGAQHQLGLDQQQLQGAQHQLGLDQQQLQGAQHQLGLDQQQLKGAQQQLALDLEKLQGAQQQQAQALEQLQNACMSTTQGSSLVKAIINGYSTDDRFADCAYTQAYELSETGLWMSGGKVVVPKSPLVKREVLEACHDAKYAGHMGMSKTWHTVDLSFTWPGMRKDVEDYVRQCDACQRNKPSTRLKAGKLQPLSIPGRRWESVSMDFIVKLPNSGERGFDSILVFVDRLSKMVHLVPTKESISAFDMATHFFHEVVRLHGMPASVITDRGPHFNSHFWEHVCALCKVAHYMSSAYHPESDGQTERVNRVIEEMLRHYVNDAHTDWAEHLPWVEFAINNSWHESIRQTPFFLNYGQHPLTPATLDLPRKVPQASAFAENVEKEVHKARQCWREAQQRMKALVEGKRREVTYKPEQLVMLSTVNMRKRKDEVGVRKLKPRYVGPFVVLRMIGLVAVHNVFHVSLWLDGEPVYEVEKLLQHKVVKVRGRGNGKGRKPGKNVKQALEFLVRWVGYSEEHDTWEPQKNLVNCDEALQQYIDEHGPLPVP